jgi:predicted ribosomally synthesized peptide with nif11-like leader
MKTLIDFIQRLQVDPAFEQQAHDFEDGDELIAFVKSEGYDFTLEQLMDELKHGVALPTEIGGMTPTPTDVSLTPPPQPDDAEFLWESENFPNGENSAALPEKGSHDFTRGQPGQGLPRPQGAIPPQGMKEKSPGGWLTGGGGRHRGFSPQRLKSLAVKEP